MLRPDPSRITDPIRSWGTFFTGTGGGTSDCVCGFRVNVSEDTEKSPRPGGGGGGGIPPFPRGAGGGGGRLPGYAPDATVFGDSVDPRATAVDVDPDVVGIAVGGVHEGVADGDVVLIPIELVPGDEDVTSLEEVKDFSVDGLELALEVPLEL